ncbi:MAG: hypothetical protein FGM27_07365 [Candidatus Omnitrophica bacterium]|nr:hypothetical protein [Candidatus Omnitrophota bacterium]
MKTKLFVGNLSFDATSDELRNLFEKYGPVHEATVVVDKRSGKSKGYGFVQMVESKDAAMALELSGHDFKGREIVVTEADSPGEGQRRRSRGQRDSGRGRGFRTGTEGWRDNGIETFVPKKKPSLLSRLFGWLKPKKKSAPQESRNQAAPQRPGNGAPRHERGRGGRRRRYNGRPRQWNQPRHQRHHRPHDSNQGGDVSQSPQQPQQG